MGLGKTLTILALITSTLDLAEARRAAVRTNDIMRESEPEVNSRATLIIAPVSTLGNWEEQILTHVYPGQLSYCVYHGKNRSVDSARLCNIDIVITTFSVVAQEWKSKRDPFHATNFYRAVLDEAHDI
ncbi:SNF2 family N-terminal domain-containing protein [Trichophaea hybrida]|nr:SNF2 family N-terminal domain-containing protein [Trichophaea hybrida]